MAGTGGALAVDIGGTKLAAGYVDAAGRVHHAARVPTPGGDDPQPIWDALADLVLAVHAVAARAGLPAPAGIGVGCGGPMRWPAGLVSPLNIPGWRGFPLRARLGDLASSAAVEGPVRVHNDAVCVAVAEHWCGAGAGYANLLGMVASTGVGGGLILRGRVVDGAAGNAGHIGHVVVDPAGPPCACGGRGCLEAVASGPSTAAWARAHGWTNPTGTDAATLTADARAGHPVARAALRRAGEALGVGIASAVALCEVTVVVVGGGLSAAGDLLFAPMRAGYARHAGLPYTRDVPILPVTLGQEAGLVGASALVLRGDAYWSAD